jgi:hypothetical protein
MLANVSRSIHAAERVGVPGVPPAVVIFPACRRSVYGRGTLQITKMAPAASLSHSRR